MRPLSATLGTANAYAGVHAPDVVGNIRVDQAWGLFQVSAAAHEVSGSYNTLGAGAVPTNLSEISGHPETKWGGAVMAAFLGEAASFGLAGAAIGIVLGRLLAVGAVRLVAATVQSLYVSSRPAPISLTWDAAALAVVVGVGVSVVSALSPAWEASLVAPVEAMARGLPVVATRVGGNAEVVVDGETGLLVPPRSPAALAEAMLRIYGDAERSRRMGQAGRERVELHFDVRRMVGDYEALYRKILESKRRGVLTGWTSPHGAVVSKILNA